MTRFPHCISAYSDDDRERVLSTLRGRQLMAIEWSYTTIDAWQMGTLATESFYPLLVELSDLVTALVLENEKLREQVTSNNNGGACQTQCGKRTA